MDQELRLIRLEEAVFFQEQKLAELENLLLAQQKLLDLQERQIEKLKQSLIRLKEENDLLMAHHSQSTPEIPPHYQSMEWHRD